MSRQTILAVIIGLIIVSGTYWLSSYSKNASNSSEIHRQTFPLVKEMSPNEAAKNTAVFEKESTAHYEQLAAPWKVGDKRGDFTVSSIKKYRNDDGMIYAVDINLIGTTTLAGKLNFNEMHGWTLDIKDPTEQAKLAATSETELCFSSYQNAGKMLLTLKIAKSYDAIVEVSGLTVDYAEKDNCLLYTNLVHVVSQ